MKVEILNFELAEPAMLTACLNRIFRFYGGEDRAVVPQIQAYLPERDDMLHYSILLPYPDGSRSHILHAIRRPGSTEVEFHS